MRYRLNTDVSYSNLQDSVGDELYQSQFKEAFGMSHVTEFDEKQWTAVFDELLSKIENDSIFKTIFHKISEKYNLTPPENEQHVKQYKEMCLVLLFSFTHFQAFHIVLRDYFQGTLSMETHSYRYLINTIDAV